MKKILLITFSLFIFTACENEPLDPFLATEDPITDPGGGSESDDLSLSVYELDIDLNISFFGTPIQSTTNSDLIIENDKYVSGNIAFSVDGGPFINETQTVTRNQDGQMISEISVDESNTVTNETIVTYLDGNVETISYDYFEDDVDDYFYTFTYDANTITRVEQESNITTVFTLDSTGRIIQKESFENDISIQKEIVTYSPEGNIDSSIITGEIERNTTFSFDDNTNPLQLIYSDNYLLQFFTDEYDDSIGEAIAQFNSTNNWNGADFDGDSFTFDLTYNSVGRIETRTIAFNLGEEFSTEINERFFYVN